MRNLKSASGLESASDLTCIAAFNCCLKSFLLNYHCVMEESMKSHHGVPRPVLAGQKKAKPQRLLAPSNDIKYVFLCNWEEKKIKDEAAPWGRKRLFLYFHYLFQGMIWAGASVGKEIPETSPLSRLVG